MGVEDPYSKGSHVSGSRIGTYQWLNHVKVGSIVTTVFPMYTNGHVAM